jgi:4-phospho-D-threonate 3-dehydrogenase / 4-phospho-D-erythronate 3-dehydrogenase
MKNLPLIGITVGDQAGIGVEIRNKAINALNGLCYFRKIGEEVENPVYGQVNKHYGYIAGKAIKQAIDLATLKEIDAIVTCPINKAGLQLGGWQYPGHTEMLASYCNVKDYAMMLVHKNLRVVHATTHVALRDVPELITVERIYRTIKTAFNGCKDLGIDEPYIGVCALNPHAGDGGLFGDEEKIIKAGIDKAKTEGFKVYDKPIPSDVAFAKAYGGAFDCVVAMYHDQGHIPVKTLGFKWNGEDWGEMDGVNITLGLPIIRTSPDHGVAYGKAGKGIADPTSMISAIKLAIDIVNNRRKDGR